MPLHICFVDYHSEMKFEQLLKIICKRYFLLFLILFLSSIPPSSCLSGGRGHNVNRHTELLWCWLCFQNIFWGLIPIAGSWVFIPFFVSILYFCFWNIYDYIWGTVKGGGCCWTWAFQGEKSVMLDAGNIHWYCRLKGYLAPRWESAVWVIWRANIVNL